jgi:hypothetical protein
VPALWRGFTQAEETEVVKTIPLTQGKEALVDDCDHEHLMQWKWQYTQRVGTGYAEHQQAVDGQPRTIRMHSLVAKRCGLTRSKSVEVDHQNGDGLDNRRANLRLATRAQNLANKGRLRNNTSGFKGVYPHSQVDKWCAQLGVGGRRLYLGIFSDPRDAARAYNEAALKHYGEFACLNPL